MSRNNDKARLRVLGFSMAACRWRELTWIPSFLALWSYQVIIAPTMRHESVSNVIIRAFSAVAPIPNFGRAVRHPDRCERYVQSRFATHKLRADNLVLVMTQVAPWPGVQVHQCTLRNVTTLSNTQTLRVTIPRTTSSCQYTWSWYTAVLADWLRLSISRINCILSKCWLNEEGQPYPTPREEAEKSQSSRSFHDRPALTTWKLALAGLAGSHLLVPGDLSRIWIDSVPLWLVSMQA